MLVFNVRLSDTGQESTLGIRKKEMYQTVYLGSFAVILTYAFDI